MADTNAHSIEVCAEVRYWEDADVNGVDDKDGTLIPFRVGNLWKPLIRLADGYIIGWPEGTTASIHYKVCDQGEYWLTDESQERIAKWKGDYVPDDFLCHGDHGYGDYIIFKVGADGKIAGWTVPDIVDKEWVLLPVDNDDLAQVMKAHPTRVTAAGIALLQQEIERLKDTPQPADAALVGKLRHQLAQVTDECARLRALSQPAAPVAQVPEVESYSADVTNARDFRIIASPDLSDYVLQWNITDGTIMTVTSVKVSREGLAHTIGVIDRVRDALPIAAAQSAKGGVG